MAKLKVGVIGAGRLGKVYVRDLATRIPETTVVAVADIDRPLADGVAQEFSDSGDADKTDAAIDQSADGEEEARVCAEG